MLRSLFNELWLYSGSAVGVKRNYSHKRTCLKIPPHHPKAKNYKKKKVCP